MDEIEIGKYIILIEVETRMVGEEQYQYFLLQNNTKYPDLTYYSMHVYDKKVSFGMDSKMNTMYLEVVKNKDSGI